MTTTFSNRPNIMNLINKYWIALSLILGIALSQSGVVNAQSSESDSSSATHDAHIPVYHVNYWISGGIITAGAIAGFTLPPACKIKP